MDSSFLFPCAIQIDDFTILNNNASLVQIISIRYSEKTYLTLSKQRQIIVDLINSVLSKDISIYIFNTFDELDYKGIVAGNDKPIDNTFYISFVMNMQELSSNGEWDNILNSLKYTGLKDKFYHQIQHNLQVLNGIVELAKEVLQQYFFIQRVSNKLLEVQDEVAINNKNEIATNNKFIDFYYLLLTGRIGGIESLKEEMMFNCLGKAITHTIENDVVILNQGEDKQYIMALSLINIHNINDEDILRIYNIAKSKMLISQVVIKDSQDDSLKLKEREVFQASQDEFLMKENIIDNMAYIQTNIIIYGDTLDQLKQMSKDIGKELYTIGIGFIVEDALLEEAYFSILPGNSSFMRRLYLQDLQQSASFFVFLQLNLFFAKCIDTIGISFYADRKYNINLNLDKQHYLLSSIGYEYNIGMMEILFGNYNDIYIYTYNSALLQVDKYKKGNDVFSIVKDVDSLEKFLLVVVGIDRKRSGNLEVGEEERLLLKKFCYELFYCESNEDSVRFQERKSFLDNYQTSYKFINDLVELLKDNLYVLEDNFGRLIKYDKYNIIAIAYIFVFIDRMPSGKILFIDGFARLFYEYLVLAKELLHRAKDKGVVLFCAANISCFELDDKRKLEDIIHCFDNVLIVNSLESNILLDYNFGLSNKDKMSFSNTLESLIVKNADSIHNIVFSVSNLCLEIVGNLYNKLPQDKGIDK